MDPDLLSAIWLSLQVGLWVVVLGAPIAGVLGFVLARYHFTGKSLLSAVLMLPLVLPPVVTGYGLLLLFGRHGPLSVLNVAFRFPAAVLAALVVGLPLYIMAARSAFESVDPMYEEVAATLGLSRWARLQRVTLPLAASGLFAGALLAFGRALGEFGATAVLAGNVEGQTRTIPLAVFAELASPGGETKVAWLAAASVIASLAAAMGYEFVRSRRLDRSS